MTQISPALINDLNNSMALALPEKISSSELEEQLAAYINKLIEKDFEKLVSLLYRLDVSENKLKNLLKLNAGENAGMIIAQLIIERQLEKIKSRKHFSTKDDPAEGEEKW